MRSNVRRYPETTRSKLTSGAPFWSRALKCSRLSVHIGTITHVLAISGQHVAVLAAVIYFSLRALAVPAVYRILTTLALIWLYILVAGAPPSAMRAGVVATLVLAAGLLGRQVAPV
jgi:predicted membrane metal-binding protein